MIANHRIKCATEPKIIFLKQKSYVKPFYLTHIFDSEVSLLWPTVRLSSLHPWLRRPCTSTTIAVHSGEILHYILETSFMQHAKH